MRKKLIFGSIGFVVVVFTIILFKNGNDILNWLPRYPQSNFRNILEIIYFITSPLLLIVAIVGLRQLGVANKQLGVANEQLDVAKKAISVNSKREALSLAAEQCKYY